MEFTHQIASKALGAKTPSRLHEIHIRKAVGGFIAKHDYRTPEGRHSHSTHHVIHNLDALKGHIEQHMSEESRESPEFERGEMEGASEYPRG